MTKKLIVLCPIRDTTGEAEALHQLVATAAGLGVDAAIMYSSGASTVMPAFAHYEVKVAEPFEEQHGVTVVVPESMVDRIPLRPSPVTWVIWWLNIDNFFATLESPVTEPRDDPDFLKYLVSPGSGILHLAQSQYARDFLAKRGAKSLLLTDYVPAGADEQQRARRDVALYNPAAGEFIGELRVAAGETLELMPYFGDPEQLASAKLYVDLGHHCTRDRLLREAAVHGCVLVVSDLGVTAHDIDTPIPAKYRIDTAASTAVQDALDIAHHVIGDFEAATADFDTFRRAIAAQRQTFERETSRFVTSLTRPRAGVYRPAIAGAHRPGARQRAGKKKR